MTILCLLAFLGGNLHGLLCCCHSVHPSQVVWYVSLSLWILFIYVCCFEGYSPKHLHSMFFPRPRYHLSLMIETKLYRCSIGLLEVLCIHFDTNWMNYVRVTGLLCNISLVMFRGKGGACKINKSYSFKVDVIRKIE